MATVAEHYEKLLADYYSWMFNDFDAKVEATSKFFAAQQIVPGKSGIVVDLGGRAGFSIHPPGPGRFQGACRGSEPEALERDAR